jgi:hypothetical protein
VSVTQLILRCDQCSELIGGGSATIGHLVVDAAEATEQLRFGLRDLTRLGGDDGADGRDGVPENEVGSELDENDDDDDELAEDELDETEKFKKKRSQNVARALAIRWRYVSPIKKTDWRIVHEICDKRRRVSDYRVSAWDLESSTDLFLKIAELSESQIWFNATNWQKLVRRILADTESEKNSQALKAAI